MKKAIGPIISVVFVALFFTGCATMESRWEEAQSENTTMAYQQFLEKYPEGKLSDQARQQLMENRWENTRSENTISAYNRFLEQYPQSEFSDQARNQINNLAKNIYVNIRETFPEGYDFSNDKKKLKYELDAILQSGGMNIVTDEEQAGVELRIEIEGQALGAYYSEYGVGPPTCYYSGARVSGKICLIENGNIIRQERFSNKKECPGSLENLHGFGYGYSQRKYAPFTETFNNIHIVPKTFLFLKQFFYIPLSLNWIFETKGNISSGPEVDNGVVYVSSDTIYAIEAANGRLKWKFQTGGDVNFKPEVSNGIVYVASKDDRVYALNIADGSLNWKFKAGRVVFKPTVSNEVVYVGSKDNYIYALDADDGSLKWIFKTERPYARPIHPNRRKEIMLDVPPLTVLNETVYLSSWDSYVYALNANEGDLKWMFKTGDEVYCRPAVANGVVYVGSDDGYIYALDANDGKMRWKLKIWSKIRFSPKVVEEGVYVCSQYCIYALDAIGGTPKWKFGPVEFISSSPVVNKGVLYFNCYFKSYNHYVYALNIEDGSLKWKFKTRCEARMLYVNSSLNVEDGTLYVSMDDNYIYALDVVDGSLKWKFIIGNNVSSVPAVEDGVVFACSKDGYVYALEAESGQ